MYATWLWDEHTAGRRPWMRKSGRSTPPSPSRDSCRASSEWVQTSTGVPDDKIEQLFALSAMPPPAVPPEDDLFNRGVYHRGALALHALRLRVGDEAFFKILREYYDQHKYATASTADFIAIAEKVSGMSLAEFFDPWLYDETSRPGHPRDEAVPQDPGDRRSAGPARPERAGHGLRRAGDRLPGRDPARAGADGRVRLAAGAHRRDRLGWVSGGSECGRADPAMRRDPRGRGPAPRRPSRSTVSDEELEEAIAELRDIDSAR